MFETTKKIGPLDCSSQNTVKPPWHQAVSNEETWRKMKTDKHQQNQEISTNIFKDKPDCRGPELLCGGPNWDPDTHCLPAWKPSAKLGELWYKFYNFLGVTIEQQNSKRNSFVNPTTCTLQHLEASFIDFWTFWLHKRPAQLPNFPSFADLGAQLCFLCQLATRVLHCFVGLVIRATNSAGCQRALPFLQAFRFTEYGRLTSQELYVKTAPTTHAHESIIPIVYSSLLTTAELSYGLQNKQHWPFSTSAMELQERYRAQKIITWRMRNPGINMKLPVSTVRDKCWTPCNAPW